MGHTVRVDAGICISSGLCVADAPAAFRFDEDEIAEPTESAAGVDLAALMAIAYNCPSGAIRILDGDRETGSG